MLRAKAPLTAARLPIGLDFFLAAFLLLVFLVVSVDCLVALVSFCFSADCFFFLSVVVFFFGLFLFFLSKFKCG